MEHRVERVARKQNITPEEARKIINQVDKMRENYVKKILSNDYICFEPCRSYFRLYLLWALR